MLKSTRYIDWVTALLVSALAPAIAVTIIIGFCTSSFADLRLAMLFGFVTALLHAIMLGLPGIAVLWRLDWLNSLSFSLVGIVAGCIPLGAFLWSTLSFGTFIKAWGPCGLPVMLEGEVIDGGVLVHFAPLLHTAGFGALAGVAFWATLKTLTRQAS